MSKVSRNIAKIVKGDVMIDFSYGSVITKPVQLGFPFDHEKSVFSVDGSSFDQNSFNYIVNVVEPNWVFDLRRLPRFDRIPGGRERVFSEFDRAGVHYVDLAGISSNKINPISPLNWVPVLTAILSGRDKRGPFVGIFENVQDAAALLGPLEHVIFESILQNSRT